ncbi:MAG: type IV pili twitching motility protein PilT, partial [Deltaproteobacteria bacterium]
MADSQAIAQAVGKLLAAAIKMGASDVHFRVGQPPMARVNGELVAIAQQPLDAAFLKEVAERMTPPKMREIAEQKDQVDFSAEWPETSRFRVHR